MSNFRSIDSASKIYDLTMSIWLDYKTKLKINYITSKYEDLIEDFDNHILNILNFLDISWDKNKKLQKYCPKKRKINTLFFTSCSTTLQIVNFKMEKL